VSRSEKNDALTGDTIRRGNVKNLMMVWNMGYLLIIYYFIFVIVLS
jgi:hypothetical protein